VSKDVLSKIRTNDVYKGLVRVLSDYHIEDYDVKDERPHPKLIIRHVGLEKEFEFPGTPRRRVNVKSYVARFRRFLQDMQMGALEMESRPVVPSKVGQVHVPMNGSAVMSDMFEPSYDLIDPREARIGGDVIQTVSARDLHAFLKVGKVFAAWINERIEAYGFSENVDYVVFSETGNNPHGGRPAKEYAITIDMAKELSMVERNEQGQKARRHFIACEKKLKELTAPKQPLTTAEFLLQTAQALVDVEKRQAAQDSRIAAIDNQVQRIQDAHYIHPECPGTAEPITKIKDRIGRKYGLSYDVITYILRESPLAPRTISIRNKHENANGAVYQAFYVKNVTDIFERFVRECKHVVGDFYEHPYIRGRFKMVLR